MTGLRITLGMLALLALTGLALTGCGGAGSGAADAQAVVGAQGAVVRAASGTAVDVPAGALSSPTTVSISTLATAPAATGYALRGDVYSLEPDGLQFASPATLRLPYSGGTPGEVVRVATFDPSSSQWSEVKGSVAQDGSVIVPIVHFSIYAPVSREEGDPEGGRIAGHVTGNDAAIAGAKVTITSGPGETTGMETETGEQGGFELEGLPAGEYALEVSASGWVTGSQTGVFVGDGLTTEVTVVLVQEGSETGAIVGHVKDQFGEVVEEALVTIVSGPTTDKETRSSISGEFSLEGLAAGTYAIRASKAGYESQTLEDIFVVAGQSVEADFSLGEGEDSTGRVVGHVLDAQDQPIAGASVVVEVSTEAAGEATTDESGAYVIEGLAAGSYTVSASKDGYESATKPAAVTAGEDTTLDFTLTAVGGGSTGSIAGYVRDAQEQPIAGASVVVEPSTRCVAETTTNEDGYYLIEEIEAGDYVLAASKAGYATQSKEATVAAGERTELDFSLSADSDKGRVVGHVRDAQEQPIAGVTVLVEGRSRCYASGTTDEDGYYAIDGVNPGDYLLLAQKDGYKRGSQEITIAAGETTEANFTLSADSDKGRVVGHVRDAQEQPIAGVTVLVEGRSRCYASGTTDEDGYYVIEDVNPGDYLLLAQKDGYRQGSQEITIAAGETTEANFTLTAE